MARDLEDLLQGVTYRPRAFDISETIVLRSVDDDITPAQTFFAVTNANALETAADVDEKLFHEIEPGLENLKELVGKGHDFFVVTSIPRLANCGKVWVHEVVLMSALTSTQSIPQRKLRQHCLNKYEILLNLGERK